RRDIDSARDISRVRRVVDHVLGQRCRVRERRCAVDEGVELEVAVAGRVSQAWHFPLLRISVFPDASNTGALRSEECHAKYRRLRLEMLDARSASNLRSPLSTDADIRRRDSDVNYSIRLSRLAEGEFAPPLRERVSNSGTAILHRPRLCGRVIRSSPPVS